MMREGSYVRSKAGLFNNRPFVGKLVEFTPDSSGSCMVKCIGYDPIDPFCFLMHDLDEISEEEFLVHALER